MATISSFRSIENKHDVYRGKDCMIKFCESLREHVMKMFYFKKKKMKLLSKEQQESYENAKSLLFVKKVLKISICKIKNFVKLEIIVIIEGNIEVLRIAYVI